MFKKLIPNNIKTNLLEICFLWIYDLQLFVFHIYEVFKICFRLVWDVDNTFKNLKCKFHIFQADGLFLSWKAICDLE